MGRVVKGFFPIYPPSTFAVWRRNIFPVYTPLLSPASLRSLSLRAHLPTAHPFRGRSRNAYGPTADARPAAYAFASRENVGRRFCAARHFGSTYGADDRLGFGALACENCLPICSGPVRFIRLRNLVFIVHGEIRSRRVLCYSLTGANAQANSKTRVLIFSSRFPYTRLTFCTFAFWSTASFLYLSRWTYV